jgi:hypothetical protein
MKAKKQITQQTFALIDESQIGQQAAPQFKNYYYFVPSTD